MWITDMRKSQDPPIMIKDVVPVIRNIFPRYDAQLHSKVERPEQYGIKLCKEAEDAIRAHFLIYPIKPSKPHSHDNRTMPCPYIRQAGKRPLQPFANGPKGRRVRLHPGLDARCSNRIPQVKRTRI